ncbi:MAG: isoprenyl transferase [Bosea sp. (in: a-proteobacteria)]
MQDHAGRAEGGRENAALLEASGAPSPRHVAIIMDGNGRWAAMRGLPRTEGHRHGVEALRRTIRAAGELGLEYITVYSFSTENWRRPELEISFLMSLFKRFVEKDLAELHAANVRVRMIGNRRDRVSPDLLALIERAEMLTKDNTALTLVIAFNYGSRDEIARAAQTLAAQVAAGTLAPEAISEALLTQTLDTADIPDPELLIRTSGEERISNFLLWQCAYAEMVFTQTLWPDFGKEELQKALSVFRSRDRRFGGLTAQAV